MNFLAHSHLSFNQPELLLGNFLADQLRGRAAVAALPEAVQKGVALHRHIDTFTDAHPIVREGIQRLSSTQGKYATVVLDILYDHLLAVNWEQHSPDKALREHCNQSYEVYLNHLSICPPVVAERLEEMTKHDWLFHYSHAEGIQYTFKRLAPRLSFEHRVAEAYDNLVSHWDTFNEEFNAFYPQLYQSAKEFTTSN